MKNKKVSIICSIILNVIFMAILLIPSLKELANTDSEKVKIVKAIEAAEYKRSFTFIPMSKSMYYIVILEDNSYAAVRADKDWYKENFTTTGEAIDGKYVEVEGTLEQLPYRVIKAVKDGYTILTAVEQILGDGVEFAYDKTECIDLFAKSYAVKGLIAAIIAIAIGVIYVLALKNDWFHESSLFIVLVICAVADLFFGIHVILGR